MGISRKTADNLLVVALIVAALCCMGIFIWLVSTKPTPGKYILLIFTILSAAVTGISIWYELEEMNDRKD